MRPGPAKKPSILEEIQGRPGHRTPNQNEPKPTTASVNAEPPIKLDAHGVKFWRDHFAGLVELGILTELDIPTFALLCEIWGQCIEASEMLTRTLDMAERKQWSVIQRSARADFLRYASRFGMTPSDRTGLICPAPPEADSLEAFVESFG